MSTQQLLNFLPHIKNGPNQLEIEEKIFLIPAEVLSATSDLDHMVDEV